MGTCSWKNNAVQNNPHSIIKEETKNRNKPGFLLLLFVTQTQRLWFYGDLQSICGRVSL